MRAEVERLVPGAKLTKRGWRALKKAVNRGEEVRTVLTRLANSDKKD